MTGYAEIYTIAERYFAPKREQLIELLRKRLTADFRETAKIRPLEIVDFGSGDGLLIRGIASRLPAPLRARLSLTCVEPEDSNFAALTATFNGAAGLLRAVTLFKGGMKEYLAQNKLPFDACLMTHMLYHIPLERWQDEIAAALARTSGHAYITLVEEDTDAYNLAKATMPPAAQGGQAIGGGYIFASDLDRVLSAFKNIDIAKYPNFGVFDIPKADQLQFIEAAEQCPQKLPGLPFVRFLSFILRKPETEIAANEKFIAALAAHLKEEGCMTSTDTVFRLTPRP